MLSGVIILILRSRSAHDGASRLTRPAPDHRGRARILAWPRDWPGDGRAGTGNRQVFSGI